MRPNIYHLFDNGKSVLYSTQLGRRVSGWFDADGTLYAWEQIDKAGRVQPRVSKEARRRMEAIEPTYRKAALLAAPNEYGTRSVKPKPFYFVVGDTLRLYSYVSTPRSGGLTYAAQTVIALEDGFSGGWDVWTGQAANGEEIDFYGFSVAE